MLILEGREAYLDEGLGGDFKHGKGYPGTEAKVPHSLVGKRVGVG